jgi:hypothetical protein
VGNFECFSWLNGSFFGDEHPVLGKRESRPISNDTNDASLLANFRFIVASIVYAPAWAAGSVAFAI